MFLGPVNVRVLKKEDKLKIKDEYNNYRVRTLKILPQCRTERSYIYFLSRYDINSWIDNIICLSFRKPFSDVLHILIIAPMCTKFYFCKHYDTNSYNMCRLWSATAYKS